MKAPRMNQNELRKLYWLVSSVGSLIQLLGSSHCMGENLARTYMSSVMRTNMMRVRTYTSVVKGSKNARSEGAAARGLTYSMEIPRFIQGMLKAKFDALTEVMEMSAIAKSAVPSITSPNMPLKLPGDTSLPY